jgi:cytochrome c
MDSFEWNKIFMGVGFSVLAVLGINELTKALYDVEKPGEPAYVVAGVEAEAAPAEAGGEAAAEALPDFGTVLASADVAAGEKVAAKCATCHSWDKGGANKIGPNLYGIVGANHAHLGDAFGYSEAMKAKSGEPWDYPALYAFIQAPQKAIKGTKMAFGGIPKSQDRINLIAFLRTMSDTPYPLPAPAPAGATEPAAAEPAVAPETPPGDTGAAPAAPETPPAEGTATPPADGTVPPAEPPAEPVVVPEAEPAPAVVPPPPPAPAPEPSRIEPNPDPQGEPAAPEGQPPAKPPTTP